MVSNKAIDNAHKICYIVQQYPSHPLNEIIKLLQMPSLDINVAIWLAIDRGWVEKPKTEKEPMKVLKTPEKWDFGGVPEQICNDLMYAFRKLAEKEGDIEEYNLSQWTNGYTSHDIMIAVRVLLNNKKLAEYNIEDGENNYIFYTLYENKDKLWGRKQFKKDPLATEKPDKPQEGDGPEQ